MTFNNSHFGMLKCLGTLSPLKFLLGAAGEGGASPGAADGIGAVVVVVAVTLYCYNLQVRVVYFNDQLEGSMICLWTWGVSFQ